MSTPRARRRWNAPRCLDTTHRNPNLPCPYCAGTAADPVIAAANRCHARIVAEDVDGFGWSA